MSESAVQVSPDSTGKKIRTIENNTVQPDGTTATVESQVVAITGAGGNITDLDAQLGTLINLMTTQNALLRAISFQLSFLNVPRTTIEDLAPFYSEASLGLS